MKSWFEIKVRALLGPEEGDDKSIVLLGRQARWTTEGIEYEADPKHRKLGFDDESSHLVFNRKRIGGKKRHGRRKIYHQRRRRFFAVSRLVLIF